MSVKRKRKKKRLRILSLRLFKKRDKCLEYIRQAKHEAEKFRKKKN